MPLKAFNYPIMSTIRLQKTDQVQHILNVLRALKFPLLDDTEIIKAVVSEYYSDLQPKHLPSRMATEEEEKGIKEGRKAIKKGDFITIHSGKEIDLDKLLS